MEGMVQCTYKALFIDFGILSIINNYAYEEIKRERGKERGRS